MTVEELKLYAKRKQIMINNLLSLGYRETKKDIFAKPVGFNLLTYELNRNIFTNWIIGKNGETLIYEENVFAEEGIYNFLKFIKYCEVYTTYHALESNFEFVTMQEQVKQLLY